MTVETFELPDVGEGVSEGELLRWLVDVGEVIQEDQPLAEVETDKAVVDLPSPYEGTVRELHAEAGEMVPVGTTIISIEVADEEEEEAVEESEEGEAGAGEAVEVGEPQAGEAVEVGEPQAGEESDAEAVAKTEAAETPVSADEGATTDASADATGRVFAPPSTRRLARELGVDIERVEGTGERGRVTDADVRAASEGGEPAPTPRSLSQATSVLRKRGERAETTHRESSATVEQASAAVTEQANRARTLAAPATRRLADELGVDLNAVPTDEARDGTPFVTPAMVHEFAERQRTTGGETAGGEVADAESEAEKTAPTPAPDQLEPGDRIPYRGVRRSIGEQMERSKFTAPHVTHTDDVDVTALVEIRSDLRSYAAEEGVDLTYLPFVMRAVTQALTEFPQVNASLDEEREEIVCHDAYNLGVATATDAGLMVPVVEDADEKGILELASETAEKVSRARDRSIDREEMQGGTFTITNVGVIGGEYATPIVNHPEVAILALGEIKQRPRVVDGEVVARHTLPLSLSVDHRVVDGAVAARFTNRVIELLERPARLLV